MHETPAQSAVESATIDGSPPNEKPPVPFVAPGGIPCEVPNVQKSSHAVPLASVASPVSESPEPGPLWLRRSDQAVVAGLAVCILILSGVHLAKLGWWRGDAVEIERLPSSAYQYRIDINRATWVEWSQLEGIGEALAKRIVADRETNGPFRTVDDVQRVKGIGPKTIEKIRAHLYANP
jgi:competence protein ComEA